jgi:ABC-type Fe3+ transport system substrate-binding protein
MRINLLSIAAVLIAAAVPAAAQDKAAVQALYEKARAEGSVMIWGPSRGEVEWIPSAFAKVFPGIEVKFVGDNDVVTKAITEARGGRSELDVMWNSVTATAPMVQRDMPAAMDWTPFGLPAAETGFSGKMGFSNKVAYAVAFTRDGVKADDLPQKWDDVLQDKYKGKMVASLFLLPRLLGGLSLSWGMDRTTQFARDLTSKTGLMLTKAPRESLIQSGERQLAYGEIDTGFRRQIKEGKPFAITLPEPVILVQFGATVMAKAPHPNAARLLAGWLTTPESRKARAEATGQLDYEKTSTDPFAQSLYNGTRQAVFDLPSNMAEREEAIRKLGPIIAGQAQ